MERHITTGKFRVSLGLMALALTASGCAANQDLVSQASAAETCKRADAIAQEAEARVAQLRAEMAATRIAAAKQEAELLQLRQQVESLRTGKPKARDVQRVRIETQRKIEAQEAALTALQTERDRLVKEKEALAAQLSALQTAQPTAEVRQARGKQEDRSVHNRVDELEASVVALTTRVTELTRGLSSSHEVGRLSESDAGFDIVVIRGDSLSKLALAYGVTVDDIRQANGLQGDLILIGQRLRIPASANPDGPASR